MWVLQPERRYVDPWKFLTYGVAHTDGYHLMVNLVGQIILGLSLEISHSSWMVALIYMLGIIAGGVGRKGPSKNNDFAPLVGASGKHLKLKNYA